MTHGPTPTVRPTDRLGDLVAEHPHLASVLERWQIDYCCGGDRRLGDACEEAAVEPGDVVAALQAAVGAPPDATSADATVTDLTPSELADHIERTHHIFLRRELPRLAELADRVLTVHGDRHPELAEVHDTFEELRLDLEPHLAREEQILFPFIREIDSALRSDRTVDGALANPVTVLRDDHEHVGELMARLNRLTDSFTTPADGCASYRSLYDGLGALVADTHVPVPKENNILFPAAIECERRLGASAGS